ncbi:hypothetical protein GCM10007416_26440 [Kroppenstedtia guangzhouensis]|uniref:SpoVT-AbrB domain-containing protein n=1 Tax=Kroppenstedtia guangzhouensis TaxID=1274356 RepID=A0ABQ1GXQ6_9BACL|nr:AbrB/MazE/SpoVT family DNA-binding domain-containing protein [Kroppenstedtia guangzhouensis]GGA52050.1 hypothetical protein GCM10007416_26440 [Kroppenstedtia guangzhouensis]
MEEKEMSVKDMALRGFRKVGRMGNSLGLGIPKDIVDKINIKSGDEYEVSVDPQTGVITARPIKRLGVDPQLLKDLEELMDEYGEAIRNLKDK